MNEMYHDRNLTDDQNIGEQLRRIRTSAGFTQKTAAALTGHSRDWIANIETGRSSVRFKDAVNLLVAYKRLSDLDHVALSMKSAAELARASYVLSTISFQYSALLYCLLIPCFL